MALTSITELRAAAPQALVTWTFLTNHAHVLLSIARDPAVRLREIAFQVGITERAVQKIIAELERSGFLTKIRQGRRNRYSVNANLPLRHPLEAHRSVAALLHLILGSDAFSASATAAIAEVSVHTLVPGPIAAVG
ncbi:MAG: MarR family transcriptional regulator [Gemmatimonadaceae bacterium]